MPDVTPNDDQVRAALVKERDALAQQVAALREAMMFNIAAIENLQSGKAAAWFPRDCAALADTAAAAAAHDERVRTDERERILKREQVSPEFIAEVREQEAAAWRRAMRDYGLEERERHSIAAIRAAGAEGREG